MIIQYRRSNFDFADLTVNCEGAWNVFLENKPEDTLAAVFWNDNGDILASWYSPDFDPMFDPDYPYSDYSEGDYL